MADLDSDTDTYIAQDARLIINIPSGFGNVTVTSWNKFVTEPTITLRADGITQIIGQTNEAIGNSGQEAAVIAFAAITPSPSEDSIYIMNTFIDGVTDGTTTIMPVGALAEIALQVNGTG